MLLRISVNAYVLILLYSYKNFSNKGRLVRSTRCEIQNELWIFSCIRKIKKQLCVVLYAVIAYDQIFDEKVLSLQLPYEN